VPNHYIDSETVEKALFNYRAYDQISILSNIRLFSEGIYISFAYSSWHP
jgi:hypothetical protein